MALVKIAAVDSPAAWKSQANAVCPGAADQTIINSYLLSGNEVDLGPGPANYRFNGEIRPQSNVFFHGQGTKLWSLALARSSVATRPTLWFDGVNQYQNGVHIYSISHFQAGMFNVAGLTDTGGVSIFNQTAPVNDVVLFDIFSTIKGVQGVLNTGIAFRIYPIPGGMTNIGHIRCWADTPDGFGFMLDGEGNGVVVDGVVYYRCGVKDAGLAATRAIVGDGTSWVCGLDLAEQQTNLIVRNVSIIACNVDGAWLNDYHAEEVPSKKGFVYLDNVATRAGQTTLAGITAGYLMPFKSGDDFVMVGNTGSNNVDGDLMANWNPATQTFTNYTPPVDMVFPVGSKTAYRLGQGNCIGIAVQASGSTTWDVYLYSADGNAVNQQMTLPDTTPFPAVFTDYLIQKGVASSPAGGWANSLLFTVDGPRVIAPQANFAVLIHLGAQSGLSGFDSRLVFDALGSHSLKLAVTTEDGTECPVEVQRWDTVNKEAKLWVKVPNLTTSTRLTLHYDANHADNPNVGPTGSPAAEAVWDSHFVGVWHLEGAGPAYLDSTSRHHDGAKHGSPVPAAFGQVFKGLNTDYIEVPDSDDFSVTTTKTLNISAWFSPHVLNMITQEPYVKWMGKGQSGQHEWQLVYYNANSSDPQKICFYCYSPSGGQGAGDYSRGAIAVDQFIRILAQAACSSPMVGNEWTWRDEVYNGLPENWQAYSLNYANGPAPIRIGIQWLGQYGGMNGTLAEIRISNIQRSLEWEKTSDMAEVDSLFFVASAGDVFPASAPKIATAPITVTAANLPCTAELFLGPDQTHKAATSGQVPFTSKTTPVNVVMPIVMPAVDGTYHIFLDVYYQGVAFSRFQSLTDVTVVGGSVGPIVWS